MTRVVVVDDHEIVRDSLVSFLDSEPDLEVVGSASSIREGSALILDLVPDVVLADLSLDDGNASELLRLIRRGRLPCRVVILTGLSDHVAVAEHVREHADGYVLKMQPIADLLEAIRTVAKGQRYFSPGLRGAETPMPEASANLDKLSRRENEIFRLVVKGCSLKEIATRLFISVKTVETHRTNINRKLGLRTITDLVRFAAMNGIAIAPRPPGQARLD